MEEIRWRFGPHTLLLSDGSELRLPDGSVWADGTEMRRFLTATGNTLTGNERAVFGSRDLAWFVVVSAAPESASGHKADWTEESREPDGRQVVIQSAVRGTVLFELVTERSTLTAARRAFDRILATQHRPQRTLWPAALAILALSPLLYFRLRRRR